jgi:hypothetical protein
MNLRRFGMLLANDPLPTGSSPSTDDAASLHDRERAYTVTVAGRELAPAMDNLQ